MIHHRPRSRGGESYGLEGDLPPPARRPGAAVLGRSADEIIDTLAAEIVAHGLACVRRFGDFQLALSGGTTPQPLYERLMYDPDCRRLPWTRTHLWLVDE